MKTVVVDGIRFTLSRGKSYHYNSQIRKHLHQYVWERANGKIPVGCEIHHKDLNPLNNDLDNLECLTIADHKKLHSDLWDDKRRQWHRENLLKNALPKAIEWQGTEEGRAWHKKHYEQMKDKLHRKDSFVCECCGEKFDAVVNGLNRFCSNKCKSKWRRISGADDEIRVCVTCGNGFSINRYSKTKNCSKSCVMVTRHRENKLKDSPNLRE